MATPDSIRRFLRNNPDKTATEIAVAFCVPLNSLSSLLKKLVDQGLLVRQADCGPRGGHIYRVPPPRLTAWERLLKDDHE